MSFSKKARMVVVATAIATVGSLALAPLTADVAQAQGNSAGKGGGGGGGGDKNGAGNRESRSERTAQVRGNGNGRGALASELKGLNAAHASPQALANAAPDSMPGKLAAFKESYQSVYDAKVALQDAEEALADAQADAVIGLVPATPEYTAALNGFLASEAYTTLFNAVGEATTAVGTQTTAYNDSYLVLTGGTPLSAEADAELLRLLGF